MTETQPELDADLIVVLDNNAYRDLAKDGANSGRSASETGMLLRSRDTDFRLQALANPTVLAELLLAPAKVPLTLS